MKCMLKMQRKSPRFNICFVYLKLCSFLFASCTTYIAGHIQSTPHKLTLLISICTSQSFYFPPTPTPSLKGNFTIWILIQVSLCIMKQSLVSSRVFLYIANWRKIAKYCMMKISERKKTGITFVLQTVVFVLHLDKMDATADNQGKW